MLTIRYFAAARAVTGIDDDLIDISEDSTLGDLERLLADRTPGLAAVLTRCSYLRDEVAVTDRDRRLGPCTCIDVLPPFAGG